MIVLPDCACDDRRVGGGHSFAANRAGSAVRADVRGARGVPPEVIAAIAGFVERHLGILDATSLPRPRLEIRSNVGSGWLGADRWSTADPSTTTLLLQRSILGDPRTLERVVAHEIVHHVDFMTMAPSEVELIRLGLGRRREGHGASFRAGAARINAIAGDGFVTETSDAEYVTAQNTKPFYLLIVPVLSGREWRLGWAWAARLSDDARAVVAEKVARDGARLVQATDELWTRGARIKRYGGVSVPRDPDVAERLRVIFTGAA